MNYSVQLLVQKWCQTCSVRPRAPSSGGRGNAEARGAQGAGVESSIFPPSPCLRWWLEANGDFYSCIPIPGVHLGLPTGFGCFGPKGRKDKRKGNACERAPVLSREGRAWAAPVLRIILQWLHNEFTGTGNSFSLTLPIPECCCLEGPRGEGSLNSAKALLYLRLCGGCLNVKGQKNNGW